MGVTLTQKQEVNTIYGLGNEGFVDTQGRPHAAQMILPDGLTCITSPPHSHPRVSVSGSKNELSAVAGEGEDGFLPRVRSGDGMITPFADK